MKGLSLGSFNPEMLWTLVTNTQRYIVMSKYILINTTTLTEILLINIKH